MDKQNLNILIVTTTLNSVYIAPKKQSIILLKIINLHIP